MISSKYFSLSLVVIFLCICQLPSSHQQEQCNRVGLNRFDERASKAILFGNINLKWPEQSNQISNWCRNTNKHLDNTEAYSKKCSVTLFKQVYSIFTYSFRNTMKQYCKSNSKQVESFLASTPCYNKNRGKEVACYTTWVDHILGAQNAVEKLKIPYLCCSYLTYLECTKKRLSNLDGCDESKVETMNNFIRSFLDPVFQFTCGEYNDENDKCFKLGSPPKKKKSQRRTKTISIPTADLLISFPEI